MCIATNGKSKLHTPRSLEFLFILQFLEIEMHKLFDIQILGNGCIFTKIYIFAIE